MGKLSKSVMQAINAHSTGWKWKEISKASEILSFEREKAGSEEKGVSKGFRVLNVTVQVWGLHFC